MGFSTAIPVSKQQLLNEEKDYGLQDKSYTTRLHFLPFWLDFHTNLL